MQDTDAALRENALAILRDAVPPDGLEITIHNLVAFAVAMQGTNPAHRALADATAERYIWRTLRDEALARAANLTASA